MSEHEPIQRRSNSPVLLRIGLKRPAVKRAATTASALAVAVYLSACASMQAPPLFESPSTAEIPPIEFPDFPVDHVHYMTDLIKDEAAGYRVVEKSDEGLNRFESPSGCTWSNRAPEAPPVAWENCGQSTSSEWYNGTQKVRIVKGESIWPLQAGNRITYSRTPRSSKGRIGTPERRSCEVSGPVQVSLRAGEFDVMKIQCTTRRYDGFREIRTWYWHEDHQEMKFVRWHARDGLLSDHEIDLSKSASL